MRPSLPLLFAGMATALPANEHNKRLLCSGKPPAFFLAGDSTTAIQSSNGGGWGNGFISFLRSPAWGVNYGHNGATTVSFVAGGDWDTVLGRVREAKGGFEPYVTIQFGHNDQKPAANITLAQFQSNLASLALDVRKAGGEPILVTSLTRRVFNATTNKAIDSLHDERLATIATAKAVGCRVLDLNLASMAYVNALGNETAQVYDLNPTDMTHLNERGSLVFGRMVADLLLGYPPNPDPKAGDIVGGLVKGACFEKWVKPNLVMSSRIWRGVEA